MDKTSGRLTGNEVTALGLIDWAPVVRTLRARFLCGNFASGLEFVNAIGEIAEQVNHHPDITLTYSTVHVTLTSHDVGGITQRDVDLARTISTLATERGYAAQPGSTVVELGLDTWDLNETKPFWAAAYGVPVEDCPDDEVVDPTGQLPSIWFQDTDPHPEPRQRFHLDIWVSPDVAEERIAAAAAAGGRLIADDMRPTFVVMADPQGNKVCFCTMLGRSG